MATQGDSRDHAADAAQRGERRIFRRALWLGLSLFAAALLLLPTNFNPILRPILVPASSMAPGLPAGSYALASRLSYGLSRYSYEWVTLPIAGRWPALSPARGDVVVFRLSRDPRVLYVKRVIGLPGDRVQMVGGRLVLNGNTVPREPAGDMRDPTRGTSGTEPTRAVPTYTERLPGGPGYRIAESDGDTGPLDNTPEFLVPAGHLFVLGDNRDNSNDSRVPSDKTGVGFVAVDHLLGAIVYALPGSGS